MKKTTISLLSIILFSCSVKYNNLESENLKGKVKSIRVNTIGKFSNETIVRFQEELSISNSLKTYDKNGFIISEKDFLDFDKLSTERKYYYKKKLINQIIQTDYFGDTLKSFETFLYNKKDSIIKKIFESENDKLVVLFNRDKENFLTEILNLYNGENTLTIKYELDSKKNKNSEFHIEKEDTLKTIKRQFDKHNRVIQEIINDKFHYGLKPYIIKYSYSENEKISIGYLEGSYDTIISKEKFNMKESLIRIETYNKNEFFPVKKIQVWNDNQDLIEFKRIDKKQEKTNSHKYEYKYDPYNNWIEVKSYNNGDLNKTIIRNIKYY